VGTKPCVKPLAKHLKDPDPMVNQMAEHALWSIWFRAGRPQANSALAKGARCLSDREFKCAYQNFSRAIEISPDFAEAYNQRGITHYLQEQYVESLRDCDRAIRLMPCHFGAWAGMGHSFAHLRRLDIALRCYERALDINPHLECIRETVHELKSRKTRTKKPVQM
jgi:tetratricopeptide (TPR) repeat protein